MTHGEIEDKLWTWDRLIDLQDVVDEFAKADCCSLVGKPKLFIIQVLDCIGVFLIASFSNHNSYPKYKACRGRQLEVVARLPAHDGATPSAGYIPSHADILVAF